MMHGVSFSGDECEVDRVFSRAHLVVRVDGPRCPMIAWWERLVLVARLIIASLAARLIIQCVLQPAGPVVKCGAKVRTAERIANLPHEPPADSWVRASVRSEVVADVRGT